jgi:hypothetical protein
MGLFETILKWIYAIDGSILFLLYLPQILAVYRDRTGAQSISLATWGLWMVSSINTGLYAHFVSKDFLFTMMSIANFAGTAGVVAMTLVRRSQFKALTIS